MSLNLLDLPIEIISQILHPLLTTPLPIPICSCCRPPPPPHQLCIQLSHPRLHSVAVPLLYGAHHEYMLDLSGPHRARMRHALTDSDSPHDIMTPQALRRVRRLRISLDRLRGWVAERVVPAVTDMILNGSLEHLDVVVLTQGEGDGLRCQLGQGRPLAAVVRLVADPYLRRARMFIGTSHGRDWCAFHEGACGGGGGVAEGAVLVDWARMAKVVDPTGGVFSVGGAV